jgi:Rne/Rng family ribonuclease
MTLELNLELTPFGARAALLADGKLQDIRFADVAANDLRGQIYLGRVRRIDGAMDAAFIDLGHGQTGYLAGRHARWLSGQRQELALARQVSEGESVLVQGTGGTGRDGKSPRVTSDIQLVGMYLIYKPRRQRIQMSARLADSPEGDRLRAEARRLFPEGGITLRAAAAGAGEEALLAEGERLRQEWQKIEAAAAAAAPPVCLMKRQDPLQRVLHDSLRPDLARIATADRFALARARGLLEEVAPALAERLECVPNAFEVNGVNEEVDRLLEARVPLAGGGDIMIESTAALTAIDVNGGPRAALEVNLEAAQEIARQIRLRRLAGTIVVDFVDLASRRERDRLMKALEAAFSGDPAATQIFPPTQLGLVQISRQRLGPSLSERLHRACPLCAGRSLIGSLRGQTERLLGEVLERPVAAGPVELRVAVDLYGFLAGEAAPLVRDFAERHGLPMPLLQPDDSLPAGGYRLGGAAHG